jgi:hypothetical protein
MVCESWKETEKRIKPLLDSAIEETGFEILKSDVEFYFAKLVNRDLERAMVVMKRIRALVDQKLSILERQDVARNYVSICPKCGGSEVEVLEKLLECSCQGCQVWVISCLECKTEWVDLIWKNS